MRSRPTGSGSCASVYVRRRSRLPCRMRGRRQLWMKRLHPQPCRGGPRGRGRLGRVGAVLVALIVPVRHRLVLVAGALALGLMLLAPPAAALPTPAAAVQLPRSDQTTVRPFGRWQAPLPGSLRVRRRFQPPLDRYGRGHRGVDLGASPGDAVLSAGDGVVSWAGVMAGRGVVVVRSGRLRMTYEPVEEGVHRGQSIRRGQPLGTLAAGHPGCTAPACLHWGLLAGERYLDPLSLLRPRVVRLVPPGGRPAALPAASSDTSLPTPAPAAVGLGSGSRHASSGYLVPMGVTGAAVAGLAGVSARVWRRRSPAGGPRPPPRRRQCPPRTQRTRRCHAAGPPGDGR